MGLFSTLGSIAGSFFGGPVGGTIGGALGGAIDSDKQQSSAEQFSVNSAQANRDFQERMSSTSWQRGVEDMRAAGINPMLAISQGGASSPGGTAAAFPGAVGAQYQQAAAASTSAESSLKQATVAENISVPTIEKIKADTVNVQSVTKQVDQTVLNLEAMRQNLIKEGYNLTVTGNVLDATVSKLKAEVPYINSQAFRAEAQSKLFGVETQLKGFDVDAATKMDNLGRDVKQLAPLVDILRLLIKR
ncbi:MAG: DNA pilot protein [Microvirus sp.]|nr:MAG: DNA pilot protein [Microvirus sp.]